MLLQINKRRILSTYILGQCSERPKWMMPLFHLHRDPRQEDL